MRRRRRWTWPHTAGTLLSVGLILGVSAGNASEVTPGQPVELALRGLAGEELPPPLPEPAIGIGPGSYLQVIFPQYSNGWSRCTANFIWRNIDSGALYLGTAGHCVLHQEGNGLSWPASRPFAGDASVLYRDCDAPLCSPDWIPLGPVVFAINKGLADDFALIEIPDDLVSNLRAELPMWGGPIGEALLGERDTFLQFGQGSPMHGRRDGSWQTLLTRGRPGVGIGSTQQSFTAEHQTDYGDSGSAAVRGARGEPLRGRAAVGIITRAFGPGLLAYGPTTFQVRELAAAAGLRISLVEEGDPFD